MSERSTREAREAVQRWVERENYKGWDPYDALMGWLPLRRMGKWPSAIAIQIQKRNPVNLRPLLGIPKGHNPKAMGLFLEAYALMLEENLGGPEVLQKAEWLLNWLDENKTSGWSGACWGYNFHWENPLKTLEAYVPSIVVTAFVGKGLFRYYEASGSARALELARSACDFILKDLQRRKVGDGVFFSYTPVIVECCYNASMLGAELLAKVSSVTGEAELRDISIEATRFVVGQQKGDGMWNYSLNLETGTERAQIDFHQGYVIDSVNAVMRYASPEGRSWDQAVEIGTEFYRNRLFLESGQALWRYPAVWPADIHNQSQGIITLSAQGGAENLAAAQRIASWTIRNMQRPDGAFFYKRYPWATIRTPMIRWGQAWMMLALVNLERAEAGIAQHAALRAASSRS